MLRIDLVYNKQFFFSYFFEFDLNKVLNFETSDSETFGLCEGFVHDPKMTHFLVPVGC
jgi:hypothetical protein